METIKSLDALRTLYPEASQGALDKVMSQITPLYRAWIEASRFVIVSTVGDEGTDASPRGDIGSVVTIADARTLWLPDWLGNNRLDTLTNIVTDGRVSLMFMVPGCNNVIRVNGSAVLTDDAAVVSTFRVAGKKEALPRSVIVVSVAEVYFQCAKALMRSALWSSEAQLAELPTAGQFLKETQSELDVQAYDEGYAEYAQDRMW